MEFITDFRWKVKISSEGSINTNFNFFFQLYAKLLSDSSGYTDYMDMARSFKRLLGEANNTTNEI